jgi:aminoglycoside phosphotransferase
MILTYNKIIPKGRYSWYTYDNVNLFDRIKLGVKIFESVNRIKYISSNRKEQSILMGRARGTNLLPPQFGGQARIHNTDTLVTSIVRKLNTLQSLPKHKDLEVFNLDNILKLWKQVGDEVKIKKKYIDEVEEIFKNWNDREYSRGVVHGDIGVQNLMHDGYEVTDMVDFEEVFWGYSILDATEMFLDLHYIWGNEVSEKFLKYYNKDLIPIDEVELMQRTRIILLTAMVRKNCKDKEEVTYVVNAFNGMQGWAEWAHYENKELDYYLEN